MKYQLLAVAALALAASASAADKPARKVRLHVSGAYCQGCAGVLTEVLSQSGVKNASKVPANRGRGHVIVLGELDGDFDLSTLATAIGGAETPHKKQAPPGVALEVVASLNEKSAESALAALAEIKGVDAKASTADVETGVISIKLSGDEKLTVDDVLSALEKADIDAQIVTEPAAKPEAKSEAAKP